jgi:hypothetical protein
MTQSGDRILGLSPMNPLQVAVTEAGDLVITSRHNTSLKMRIASLPDSSGFLIRTENAVTVNVHTDKLFEMVKKDV